MYIEKLEIVKFRGLDNVTLGPFGRPGVSSDSVVLVGANGSGKTSILELVAYITSLTRNAQYHADRDYQFHGSVTLGFSMQELVVLRSGGNFDNIGFGVTDISRLQTYFTTFDRVHLTFNAGLINDEQWNFCMKASQVLRSHYQRSLGFFIRADRRYSQRGFNKQVILSYDETRLPVHAERVSFAVSESQYQDVYDHVAQLRYHHDAEMGQFIRLLKIGEVSESERPADPVKPYVDLFAKILPGYAIKDDRRGVPTDFFIQIPGGKVVSFGDLSSGEKEVFLQLAFFVRHDVKDAIIVIDEPELHLHPQLSRALVREMQLVAPGSQLWMATHNAEIIDEMGRDKVLYVSRSVENGSTSITSAANDTTWVAGLRHMFGESGFIGVGRTLVFSEGLATSADRKTFIKLFPGVSNSLKIVPIGGVEGHLRINSAIMALLEEGLAWIQFYLIRDRDYLTADMAQAYQNKSKGRIHILQRCQIENYLLDFDVIARVMAETYEKVESSEHWKSVFRGIALQMSGEVSSAMIAYRLNQLASPQDFSLPRLFSGKAIVDESGSLLPDRLKTLLGHVQKCASEVAVHVATQVEPATLDAQVNSWLTEVSDCFAPGSDSWITFFPGKELLAKFAKTESLGPVVALINNTLKAMVEMSVVPDELSKLVDTAVAGKALA